MMKHFAFSRILAVLTGIGAAAFGSLILADEPPTNQAASNLPITAAVSVEKELQRPRSSDATGSKAFKREIHELHEDVRALRRDVSRLIELLQGPPTEAKSQVEPGQDRQSSANESNLKDELSDDIEPISDELVWERLGIRIKPAKVESDRYRGGLEVIAVRSGGPGAQQGIRDGDVLIGLDKWETLERKNVDFVLRKFGLTNEATIKFVVLRGGATLRGHLTLPAVPKTGDAKEAQLLRVLTESNPEFEVVWDLTLNEAILIALQNSKIMRRFGVTFQTLDKSDITIVSSLSNSDASTTEIAIAVRNLISDVEKSYWKHWEVHHDLESAREMRNSAQKVWKIVWLHYTDGVADALTKSLADHHYYDARSILETLSRDLRQHELQLRKVLGLAQRDGRFIRSADEPSTNKVILDWNDVHASALANSLELIQQRRIIEECENQLVAARKDLPEALFGSTTADEAMLRSMQFGHRRALVRVRTLQLNHAREKARLEEMELATSHQLMNAIRQLDSTALLLQSAVNHATAAKAELESATALFLKGNLTTIERLLDSQRRRFASVKQLHRAIGQHAIAIKEVNLMRGTLLQHCGVKLASSQSSEDTK